MADRLRQISQDAQLAATRGVASQAGGSQHHDHGARQLGILFDLLRQREAVHTRHMRIGQDQGEGLSRAARSVERRECHLSVFHRLRFHAPARKQVYQGSPGGLIIIHDEDAHIDQADVFRGQGPRGRLLRPVKERGEVELASPAGLAFDPGVAFHKLHQASGDREAQSRASVPARGRTVRLCEGVEDEPVLLGGNPNARVTNGEMQ